MCEKFLVDRGGICPADKPRDCQPPLGNPFGEAMEEVCRLNMAMMERAFNLFAPFRQQPEGAEGKAADPSEREIAALREEIERLRKELAAAKGPR